MRPELIVWLAAIIGFGILEAATISIVSLWFMGGALAALIASACGASFAVQIVVFFVISILLLACLRPFVRKYVNPRKTRTNADRIIGQKGVVVEEINNLQATGAVKVGGVEWTARATNDRIIAQDEVVRILKIEGVKLYVEPDRGPDRKGE